MLAVEGLLVAALLSVFSFFLCKPIPFIGTRIMPGKSINFIASLAARCGQVTKFGTSGKVVERVCLIGLRGRHLSLSSSSLSGKQPS